MLVFRAMVTFPEPLADENDEIATALEVGAAQWARGERDEAIKWLRKAIDLAFDAGFDDRGLELSKRAAELSSLPAPEKSPPEVIRVPVAPARVPVPTPIIAPTLPAPPLDEDPPPEAPVIPAALAPVVQPAPVAPLATEAPSESVIVAPEALPDARPAAEPESIPPDAVLRVSEPPPSELNPELQIPLPSPAPAPVPSLLPDESSPSSVPPPVAGAPTLRTGVPRASAPPVRPLPPRALRPSQLPPPAGAPRARVAPRASGAPPVSASAPPSAVSSTPPQPVSAAPSEAQPPVEAATDTHDEPEIKPADAPLERVEAVSSVVIDADLMESVAKALTPSSVSASTPAHASEESFAPASTDASPPPEALPPPPDPMPIRPPARNTPARPLPLSPFVRAVARPASTSATSVAPEPSNTRTFLEPIEETRVGFPLAALAADPAPAEATAEESLEADLSSLTSLPPAEGTRSMEPAPLDDHTSPRSFLQTEATVVTTETAPAEPAPFDLVPSPPDTHEPLDHHPLIEPEASTPPRSDEAAATEPPSLVSALPPPVSEVPVVVSEPPPERARPRLQRALALRVALSREGDRVVVRPLDDDGLRPGEHAALLVSGGEGAAIEALFR